MLFYILTEKLPHLQVFSELNQVNANLIPLIIHSSIASSVFYAGDLNQGNIGESNGDVNILDFAPPAFDWDGKPYSSPEDIYCSSYYEYLCRNCSAFAWANDHNNVQEKKSNQIPMPNSSDFKLEFKKQFELFLEKIENASLDLHFPGYSVHNAQQFWEDLFNYNPPPVLPKTTPQVIKSKHEYEQKLERLILNFYGGLRIFFESSLEKEFDGKIPSLYECFGFSDVWDESRVQAHSVGSSLTDNCENDTLPDQKFSNWDGFRDSYVKVVKRNFGLSFDFYQKC